MGLSRNKVAVSEGAAGSPPFYGENTEVPKEQRSLISRNRKMHISQTNASQKQDGEFKRVKVFRCSIFRVCETLERPGGVAQLGEHLPCKQGVKSSNLFISTKQRRSAIGSKKRQEQDTGS